MRLHSEKTVYIQLTELEVICILDELISEKIAVLIIKENLDVSDVLDASIDERKSHIIRAIELIDNNFFNDIPDIDKGIRQNFLLSLEFTKDQINKIPSFPSRRTKIHNFPSPEKENMWIKSNGWDEYIRWISITCLYKEAEQELEVGK
jgi:hypothetical protein